MPGGSWTPGQVASGTARVINDNQIVNGWVQAQKGLATFPPSTPVTTPSAPSSGGTAINTTGYDVMVYASATSGFGTVVVGQQFLAGGTSSTAFAICSTAPASTPLPFWLPYGQGVIVNYSGTLTWHWLAV